MAGYDKAHELARELKASDEYKEYQKAKQELMNNKDAMAILKDFQKKRLDFEMSLLTGKGPDESKKQEMERLSELVNMHGAVKRFLEAEQRVMIMMTDIQKIITDALNLLEYTP